MAPPLSSTTITTTFLLLLHSLTAVTARDLITTTCSSTSYPSLCLSTLRSLPAPPTTIQSLLAGLLDVSSANSTATSRYASSEVGNAESPPLKKALGTCSERFGAAAAALRGAKVDAAAANLDHARVRVHAAREYPEECTDLMWLGKGTIYPAEFLRRSQGLEKLCTVALDAMSKINTE